MTHWSTIHKWHCLMILMILLPRILASIWQLWREPVTGLFIIVSIKERFANQLETNLVWHLSELLATDKSALLTHRKGFVTTTMSLFQNSQYLWLNRAVTTQISRSTSSLGSLKQCCLSPPNYSNRPSWCYYLKIQAIETPMASLVVGNYLEVTNSKSHLSSLWA